MSREWKPPLPRLPDQLPLVEPVLDRVLDAVSAKVSNSPPVRLADALQAKMPTVAEQQFNTPLGSVTLPRLEMPQFSVPALDRRKKDLLKAAIGDDISGFVEKIPGVGAGLGPLADSMEDLYMAKIQETASPEEYEWFKRYDKISPITTLAMLRSFIKVR